MIFEIGNSKATKIKTKDFKNELELHKLIDNNLEELFEIRYIKDEHVTEKYGRIETLGLDNGNRPVVIEYKKSMEKGHLSQANKYLMWIKNYNADFELLARKNLKIEGEIDFLNPRIICFAQEYNIDDKCLAIALGAELWKYQYYENETLVIVREEEPELLIKTKPKNYTLKKNINNFKSKSEVRIPKPVEEHLKALSDELKGIFEELNIRVYELSSTIERYTTSANILYKTSVNFIGIKIQKNKLRLVLRTIENKISDPKKLTKAVPKSHGWGNFTHILFIEAKENKPNPPMDDIMNLVTQSFKTTQ